MGQAVVQRCKANVNFHDEEKPLYPPTGCRGAPLLSPYLVINEDGLPYGAALHASLATSYLTNYQQDIARVWFTVLIITGDYVVCT